MWSGGVNNLGEALFVSLLGISTVFTALIALAIAVVIVSKVLQVLGIGKEEKKETKVASAVSADDGKDDELYAAIVAAVSEEMKLPVDQFQVVSIKEIV